MMFDIQNVATEGFDRAIIAMRRERGGREASDSEWIADADDGFCLFEIGAGDKEECLRLINTGDRDFMMYIAVWAHIEAPAEWWAVFGGYFIAQSDVVRNVDIVTRSVMTNYGHLRNLLEVTVGIEDYWKAWNEIRDMVAKLPESWMLIENLEVI